MPLSPLRPPAAAISDASAQQQDYSSLRRVSQDSQSSVSTTSIIFEEISQRVAAESAAEATDALRGAGRTGWWQHRNQEDHSSGGQRSASDLGDRLLESDDADTMKDEDLSVDYDLETGPFLGGTTNNNSHSRDEENGCTSAGDGRGRGRGSTSTEGDGANARGILGRRKGRSSYTKMDPGLRRILIWASLVVVSLWVLGLFLYIRNRSYLHGSSFEHDPQATVSRGNLRKITRDQLADGSWQPKRSSIQWVAGPDGEDGLLLESGSGTAEDEPFLAIKDVQSLAAAAGKAKLVSASALEFPFTLVASGTFEYGGTTYQISTTTTSPDFHRVLLAVNSKSNWRHSKIASYFVLEVMTQTVEPLVPGEPDARVQLAQWCPTSQALSFTRDNNLYVRHLSTSAAAPVQAITTDGGAELFYGVPDWVYEEEVFGGASATWWSPDGRYLAFLRTNETGVPSYPVQYFLERPSGTDAAPGEENYPEVREIKYPKAGAHNPVVDLQFYDVAQGEVFSVPVSGDFADDNRLITTVLWAGERKVLVKETNRISDVMRVVVVDVAARAGTAVRTVDVGQIDGGWFEISERTRFVPRDPARQRPDDGYIDTIVYNNGDHLAYFTPPDNPEPIMLTTGPDWEVVDAPSAVDLERNLVYFAATIEGSTQRHVYSVRLQDGGGLTPLTNTSSAGFYAASFSAGAGAGYVLLEYRGPNIPWQKVLQTPAATAAEAAEAAPAAEASSSSTSPPPAFEHTLQDNAALAERARKHALPLVTYGTLEVADGVTVNYMERRPPHFDASKRYPVLFQQYSGPGSQEVKQTFQVDFQSYVAASLDYVVVTVDPRGTGFLGRRHRVVVRGQLGVLEAHDHIAAARHWAGLPYVDAARLAIWGWSFGGFTTLKTLEQDAGQTFRYGMAVAPVTDWRFYDSVYTERYMDTPQANTAGYDASAVQNATALGANVRFLVMHGVADDNVHLQNSLALLDRLDLAGVSNYDVHVFPDSDHSIYFHNGHQIVYDKLENWLINAFNGEWLKVDNAKPAGKKARRWED